MLVSLLLIAHIRTMSESLSLHTRLQYFNFVFVCIYTYYNITNNTIAASHLLFFLHRTHKNKKCSVFIFLGISASHYKYMFYSENVLIHELIHLAAIPRNLTTEWKEK